jgi:hypothetical protein
MNNINNKDRQSKKKRSHKKKHGGYYGTSIDKQTKQYNDRNRDYNKIDTTTINSLDVEDHTKYYIAFIGIPVALLISFIFI